MLAVYQPVFLVGVSNFFFLVVILGEGWRDPPLPVPSRWSRAFRPCLCVSIWKDDIHHISPLTLRPPSLVPMSLYMKFFVFEGVPKWSLLGVPLLGLPPSSLPDPIVLPHILNLESEPANGGEMCPEPFGHPSIYLY